MTKRNGLFLALFFALLFLFINRDAYKGYFQADDWDTLTWSPILRIQDYLIPALSPRFQALNFRPVAHFYYHVCEYFFGLKFGAFVAVLQAIHLLNVWLLWSLIRRLGAPPLSAAASSFFYGLHMALFDNFWEPMYVFDVLCGTFCLLSFLLYMRGTTISLVASFAAYWFAYRSKELAVMLPLVLACYEYWFGERRWLRLLPFFLASLSFGVQGLLFNPNKDNEYTFRFTLAALIKTTAFYSGRVFLVPYLGIIVPLAAIFLPSRRVFLGLATMGLFFFPLAFLPGRLYSPYCYVPFIGLAIALSAVLQHAKPAVIALLFLIWVPLDAREFFMDRERTLARDEQIREWVATVQRFALDAPRVNAVVWSGVIPGFQDWGVSGVLVRYLKHPGLPVHYVSDPQSASLLQTPGTAFLVWDPQAHKLKISITQPAS